MEVRWQSEIDPYASRVLAKHWPNVPNLGDIRTIDWSTVERVDLICAGYPCQPFSLAGIRGGDADPRHLWPHVADAVRHLRPRWALLENVPGHLSLGFGRVLGDLAELGYDCEWDCIPASAVGAPHLRYRVFVVAHARSDTIRDAGRSRPPEPQRRRLSPVARDDGTQGSLADATHGLEPQQWSIPADRQSQRPRPRAGGRAGGGDAPAGDRLTRRRSTLVGRFLAHPDGRRLQIRRLTQPPRLESKCRALAYRRRDNRELLDTTGGVDWWSVEPDVGRVAHGIPARVDRLRCLGNAVVPQVAEWVGRRIMEAHR